MKDYRGILIMTDLDGTFMGAGKNLVARNLEALARFKAGGGLFSFATGRVHTTVERFLLPGWRELINCPAILCNGACVFDPPTGRLLHEVFLNREAALPIAEKIFAIPGFNTTFYAGRDYFCHENTPPSKIDPTFWHKLVFTGPEEAVNEGYAMLAENGEQDYRFFRSSPRILEILPKNGGKGPMLRWMKEYYQAKGMSMVTIGAGDYENDMDLLEWADVAIAVENALPQVKAVADRVMCHHTEGVIGDIVNAIDRGELF